MAVEKRALNAVESDTVSSGAGISMDEAIERAIEFLDPNVPHRIIEQPSGLQVIQDGVVNEAGDVVSKRVGFDVNPNSAHVQDLGPYLNLQTQINNKPVKK